MIDPQPGTNAAAMNTILFVSALIVSFILGAGVGWLVGSNHRPDGGAAPATVTQAATEEPAQRQIASLEEERDLLKERIGELEQDSRKRAQAVDSQTLSEFGKLEMERDQLQREVDHLRSELQDREYKLQDAEQQVRSLQQGSR